MDFVINLVLFLIIFNISRSVLISCLIPLQERGGEAGLELEHGRAGGRAAQGRAEVRLGVRGRRPRLGEALKLFII